MINGSYVFNQLIEQINQKNLSAMQQNKILSQYKDLLLSQLQVGDQIDGLVTKLEDSKLMLQLKSGMSISIELKNEVEIGKWMQFVVQAKEQGKLYLQPIYDQNQAEPSLIEKTMTTLNLPQNDVMKELITDFMQKHLPLAKDMLLKAYQFQKEYDLPSKVVANLSEHHPIPTELEVQKLSALRQNGLNQMVEDIKEIVQRLEHHGDLVTVFNALTKEMPQEKLDRIINSFLKEPLEKNRTPEILSDRNTNEKEVMDTMKTEERSSPKREALVNTLKYDFLREDTEKNMLLIKKVVEHLYKEEIHVNIDHMRNEALESEKPYTTYQLMNRLTKALQQTTLLDTDKEYVQGLQEPLRILQQVNVEGNYFIFPLSTYNKQAQGELYFFKPKKSSKGYKDRLYVVLALSFPHIHHIEVHINKEEKNITLMIKVEDDGVRNYIAEHGPRLNDMVEGLGFSLKQLTWSTLKVDQRVEPNHQEYLNDEIQHMDFKI